MILGLWSCSSQGYLWVTDVASADSSVRAGWQLGAQLFPLFPAAELFSEIRNSWSYLLR